MAPTPLVSASSALRPGVLRFPVGHSPATTITFRIIVTPSARMRDLHRAFGVLLGVVTGREHFDHAPAQQRQENAISAIRVIADVGRRELAMVQKRDGQRPGHREHGDGRRESR